MAVNRQFRRSKRQVSDLSGSSSGESAVRVKHSASSFDRWLIPTAVGAGIASTVDFVATAIAIPIFTSVESLATKLTWGVAYPLTGIAFLYTTRKTKNEFDQSSKLTSELVTNAQNLRRDGGLLEQRMETINNRLQAHRMRLERFARMIDDVNPEQKETLLNRLRQFLDIPEPFQIEEDNSTTSLKKEKQNPLLRTLVSFGAGSSLSAGMHYILLKFLINFIPGVGPAFFTFSQMDDVLAGLLLLYTAVCGYKKIKNDSQQGSLLTKSINIIEKKHPMLKAQINSATFKVGVQRDALKTIKEQERKVQTRLSEDGNEFKEIKLQPYAEPQFGLSDEGPTPSVCCNCNNRYCSCMKNVWEGTKKTAGVLSVSYGFASSVYYCLDVSIAYVGRPLGLIIGNAIGSSIIGLTTLYYLVKKIKVNAYETSSIVETVKAKQQECEEMKGDIDDLEKQVDAQEEQLEILIRQSQLLDAKDREILEGLKFKESPLPKPSALLSQPPPLQTKEVKLDMGLGIYPKPLEIHSTPSAERKRDSTKVKLPTSPLVRHSTFSPRADQYKKPLLQQEEKETSDFSPV